MGGRLVPFPLATANVGKGASPQDLVFLRQSPAEWRESKETPRGLSLACPHMWWEGFHSSCFFLRIPKAYGLTLGKGNSSNVYKNTWRFNHLLEEASRGRMNIECVK